jgi:hypothetical protein
MRSEPEVPVRPAPAVSTMNGRGVVGRPAWGAQLGGAFALPNPQDTAFGDRSAPFLLGIECNWENVAVGDGAGVATKTAKHERPCGCRELCHAS